MLKKVICFLVFLNVGTSFGMTEFQAEAYKYGWRGGVDAVNHLAKISPPVVLTTSSGIKDLVKDISVGSLKLGWGGLKACSDLNPKFILLVGGMVSMYFLGRNGNRAEILKNRDEILKNREELRQFKQETFIKMGELKTQAEESTKAAIRAENQSIKNGKVLDTHTQLHKQHLEEEQKTQGMIKDMQGQVTGLQQEQVLQRDLMGKLLTQNKEMADASKCEFKKVRDDQNKTLEMLNELGDKVQTQLTGIRQYMEQSNKDRIAFESRQEQRQMDQEQTLLLYSQQQTQMMQAQNEQFNATQEKLENMRMTIDMHQRENKEKFRTIKKLIKDNGRHLQGIELAFNGFLRRGGASIGILGTNAGPLNTSYSKTPGKVFDIGTSQKNEKLITYNSSYSSDSMD